MLNYMATCRNADKKPHDNNLETSSKITPIASQKGVMSMINEGASTLGNLATKVALDSNSDLKKGILGLSTALGKSFAPLSGNRYRSLG